MVFWCVHVRCMPVISRQLQHAGLDLSRNRSCPSNLPILCILRFFAHLHVTCRLIVLYYNSASTGWTSSFLTATFPFDPGHLSPHRYCPSDSPFPVSLPLRTYDHYARHDCTSPSLVARNRGRTLRNHALLCCMIFANMPHSRMCIFNEI